MLKGQSRTFGMDSIIHGHGLSTMEIPSGSLATRAFACALRQTHGTQSWLNSRTQSWWTRQPELEKVGQSQTRLNPLKASIEQIQMSEDVLNRHLSSTRARAHCLGQPHHDPAQDDIEDNVGCRSPRCFQQNPSALCLRMIARARGAFLHPKVATNKPQLTQGRREEGSWSEALSKGALRSQRRNELTLEEFVGRFASKREQKQPAGKMLLGCQSQNFGPS